MQAIFSRSTLLGGFLWLCIMMQAAQGQTGFGLRFASDINYFLRAEQQPLVTSYFSNIAVGPFFKYYNRWGGIETGLNFTWKPESQSSGLPLVAQDFNQDQHTALMGTEATLKVGPRLFKIFYPKFGITAGKRFSQTGFWKGTVPSNYELNTWYATLPIGFTIDLPTGFGNTGFGFFYHVGLSSVIANPYGDARPDFDGSRLRSFNFEIHVMIGHYDNDDN